MKNLPTVSDVALLQKISLLDILTPESKQEFLAAISIIRFSRYQYLFQPGQTLLQGYFILQGATRQYYLCDGKEIVTRLSVEGEMCGTFYSFISGKPTFEYAEAVEDVVVAAIARYDIERLCAQYIDIANLERKITEMYLIQEQDRALMLQFHSAQERYQDLLETRPDIFLRFSVGSIASYLGMTQETLSRLRTKKIVRRI